MIRTIAVTLLTFSLCMFCLFRETHSAIESNRQVLEFVLEAGIIYLVIGDHDARSKLLAMWKAAPKAVLDRLHRGRRSV
jgi:hypothetical protein